LRLLAGPDLDRLDDFLVALGGQRDARAALAAELGEQFVLQPVGQRLLSRLALLALDGDEPGVLGDAEDLLLTLFRLRLADEHRDGVILGIDLEQLTLDLSGHEAAGEEKDGDGQREQFAEHAASPGRNSSNTKISGHDAGNSTVR